MRLTGGWAACAGLLGVGGIVARSIHGCASGPSRTPSASRLPNVVLFVVDDFGAADTNDTGSRFYRTPSFSRFMREGMRFTEAYSASALCSASRASLLTGKLPHRVGITGAIVCVPGCMEIDTAALPASAPAWQKVRTPSFLTRLPLGELTFPELLRARGYVTAHVGKWHLGGEGFGPLDQGYDLNVAGSYRPNAPSHLSPYGLEALSNGPRGEYLADRLTAEAETFIEEQRATPFLLSLWHYGVHTPIEAPAGVEASYETSRDPHDSQRNPTYAAMIDRIDASLGRILDKLDALGLCEDTLVIVTSDNGGLMLDGANGDRVAVTNNAPYRGGKAHIYEGGTRVPFGMRWKGHIEEGTSVSTPVSGIDVFETIAEAAGVVPSELPSHDGTSLLPLTRGGSLPVDRALTWHLPHYLPGPKTDLIPIEDQQFLALPASAIRIGSRKLVCIYGEGPTPEANHYELYDLLADPGETTDLASLEPDTVARLRHALETNLAKTRAIVPLPNPQYRPSFGEWRMVQDCTATLGAGVLRVSPTGPAPNIFGPIVSIAAPCRIIVRFRAPVPTTLILYYGTGTDISFTSTRRLTAMIAGGADFVDATFDVPDLAGDVISRLRLDPRSSGADVEIDSIIACDPADPTITRASWTFSGIDGVPFGGAFYAYRDTNVSHSASSLDVVMGGSAPIVSSSLVQIFGPLRVRIRMSCMGSGNGAVGCSTSAEVSHDETFATSFALVHDGQFHDYVVELEGPVDSAIRRLWFSLGDGPGVARIESIHVSQYGSPGESLVAVWEFGPR